MRTLTAITLGCLLSLPATAQNLPTFPADQFGSAVLVPAPGAVFYESTFNDVPNFEPLDDFTDANRYRRLARSVGRLDIQVAGAQGQAMSTCTATLIADDVLITNYHCIPGMNSAWRVTAAQVRMGYMTLADHGTAYAVYISPLESNRRLDYAILRVPSSPGQRWGHIPLRVRDPNPGEELFIMHHPEGVPQRLTRRNCRIKDGSASVSGIEIRHRCDTQGGSSGSLIFSDNAANGQFEAVGLHYAGFAPDAVDPYNSAKRMTSIVAQSPLLRRLASGSPAPPSRPTPRPPTQPVSSGPRTISASTNGTLSSTSTRHTFDGQAGDVVTVSLSSSDFDPILDVLGPSGQTLATDDDSGGSLNSQVTDLELPATGLYTIVVRSYTASSRGATGSYSIAIEGSGRTLPAPPSRPTPPTQPISTGPQSISASTSGLLSASSTRHTFDGQSGDVITVTLESQAFDPVLDVLAPDGTTLATNDDAVGLNARVSDLRLPAAGTYTFVVRSYAGGSRAATGSYSLTISGSRRSQASATTTHAIGQSRAGRLEVEGRSSFTFSGRAGQQIWAEVTSDFDSFLTIMDSSGRSLGTDDDSGEGTDARLMTRLPSAGIYTVTVSAYSGADYEGVRRSGAFTLRLGEGF